MKMKTIRIGSAVALLVGLGSVLPGQPECRSILGAHMKPAAHESIVSWGGELVTVPAYLEDRFANSSMLYLGIGAASRSRTHQVYFEGGAKISYVDGGHGTVTVAPEPVADATHVSTGSGTGKGKPATGGEAETAGASTTTTERIVASTKRTYGWREAFYQYTQPGLQVRGGLSTTRLGDYFLVNERMFGLSYAQRIGSASISAAAGTVAEFSRMTEFCGVKRLTNLVDKEKYETVGEELGDTNLAGFVVAWDLRKDGGAASAQASGDEFRMTSDLAAASPRGVTLSKVGLLFYHESDTRIDTAKHWFGGLAQVDLPLAWKLKAQGMFQDATGPDAFIYYGALEKDLFWANASNTSLHAGYFGRADIDGVATFEATFTNLFKGEIMRMDAIDIPLAFAGIRHNFGDRRRTYVQLQGALQTKAEKMREVDLEVGADFFGRLRVAAIGSYVHSTATKKADNLVGKMEVRLGF